MAEYRVLKILKSEGANVHVRNPTGIGRTSDFIVDEVETDVKGIFRENPTTGTVKTAIKSATHGGLQAEAIIIDATQTNLTPAIAEEGINRAFYLPEVVNRGLRSVRIIITEPVTGDIISIFRTRE